MATRHPHMHLFGAHPSDAGGIHMAVRRAGKAGMRSMQLFSAIPKFYGDRTPVKPERIQRFNDAVNGVGLDKGRIIAHAAYVLNTASAEPDRFIRSRDGLAKELERSTALGLGGFCFHPGSAGSSDPAGACTRIAEAITHALEQVPASTTRVLIENTAGAGRTMARTAAEVGSILSQVPAKLRPRTGYGLDTCHLYASGHDIAKSPSALSDVLDGFADATGESPSFFHLNDSETELGSNRDRHALIGEGRIGVDAFRWLLADRRAQDVPLILETPQATEEVSGEDDTPDENDVKMLRLLESLV